MGWDPSITQRVDHALRNATDKSLVLDMFAAALKNQGEEVDLVRKRLQSLENINTKRVTEDAVRMIIRNETKVIKERMRWLTKFFWILIGAIASDVVLNAIQLVRK